MYVADYSSILFKVLYWYEYMSMISLLLHESEAKGKAEDKCKDIATT